MTPPSRTPYYTLGLSAAFLTDAGPFGQNQWNARWLEAGPSGARYGKNRLFEVVDHVEKIMNRLTITKHGRPAAVLISVADLEGLLETIDILRDPEEAAAVREAS